MLKKIALYVVVIGFGLTSVAAHAGDTVEYNVPSGPQETIIPLKPPMVVVDSGTLSLAAGDTFTQTYSDTNVHEVIFCPQGGEIHHSIDGDDALSVDIPTTDGQCFIDNFLQTKTWSVLADSSNGATTTVFYRIRHYENVTF